MKLQDKGWNVPVLWTMMGAVQIIHLQWKKELPPSKLQLSGLLVFSDTTPHSNMHLRQIWPTQK